MKFVGVVLLIIGILLLLTHAGRSWSGLTEEGQKKADEKNKEDFWSVLIGIALMVLGGYFMAN